MSTRPITPVSAAVSARARLLSIAAVVAAALLAVVPELVRGPSCGHDFNFHLVSWMDALSAWRSGIPYPHWTPSANWGAGEPRFVFYPPLTWMLGAALGAVLPWAWVPVAITFLLLAATGLGARLLARELLPEPASTLAAALAIFSGYALFTAYERTAFAELAGGFWMPLLVLFALRGPVAAVPVWRAALSRNTLWLALVVAGAWLSNPTVAVMACYLLIALALLSSGLERTLAPLVRAAAALVLGVGLVAVYLVPVAMEQPWADLNQVNQSPGQMLENNWLFARHADPVLGYHDQVLHQVSLVASAMIALAVCAALVCRGRGRWPGERRWWLPMALLPVAVLLLQLPVSHPVWVLLPKLRYLQFPWRWLVALEAPMAILLVAALWPRGRWPRRAALALAALGCVACTLHASRYYYQACDLPDSVAGTSAQWRSGQGVRGMDEYVPPGADNDLVAESLPAACLLADPLASLGQPQPMPSDAEPDDDPLPPLWSPADRSCVAAYDRIQMVATHHREHYAVAGLAPRSGYLVLRLRRYPFWRIRLNGRVVPPLATRTDGLLVVPVPAGPFQLTIDWQPTADVLLGRAVSMAALILMAGLAFSTRARPLARIK